MKNESVRETRRVEALPKSALAFRPLLMKYMAHEIGFIWTCSDSIQDSQQRNMDSLLPLAGFIPSRLPASRSALHRIQIKSWHAVMTNISHQKACPQETGPSLCPGALLSRSLHLATDSPPTSWFDSACSENAEITHERAGEEALSSYK